MNFVITRKMTDLDQEIIIKNKINEMKSFITTTNDFIKELEQEYDSIQQEQSYIKRCEKEQERIKEQKKQQQRLQEQERIKQQQRLQKFQKQQQEQLVQEQQRMQELQKQQYKLRMKKIQEKKERIKESRKRLNEHRLLHLKQVEELREKEEKEKVPEILEISEAPKEPETYEVPAYVTFILDHYLNKDNTISYKLEWDNHPEPAWVHESEIRDENLKQMIKTYNNNIGSELYTNLIHDFYGLKEYNSWRELFVLSNNRKVYYHSVLMKNLKSKFLSDENHVKLSTGLHIKKEYIDNFKEFLRDNFNTVFLKDKKLVASN